MTGSTDDSSYNNPEYSSHDDRMKSFRDWPKSYATYQIHNLADAGFYYTGESDKIQCFFCGVRLHNWNDTENPMDQHIIWSPNCSFLKMTKGDKYIYQTREKFTVKDE